MTPKDEDQTKPQVEFPEHGSIIESPKDNPDTGIPDPAFGVVKERAVHDKDKDGNVTGWHKELVKGKGN
jgi:hypothetical protein